MKPIPMKLKKILKQNLTPPSSHRHCLYCDKVTKFKYNRLIGHSECIKCGCRFTKNLKGGKEEDGFWKIKTGNVWKDWKKLNKSKGCKRRKYISEDQIKYSNKHLESIESLIETIQLVQANLYKDISGKGYATILADAITKYRLLNSK